MSSTSSASPVRRLRVSLRGRTAAILLALAIELLIALMLLWMAPRVTPKEKPKTVVFGIEASEGEQAPAEKDAAKAPEKARKRAGEEAEAERPAPPTSALPPPPVVPSVSSGPPSFIVMSRRDYAASDIAKAPAAPAGDQGNTQTADAGGGSGADDTPRAGTGPHGETLYAADWYRRPTNAQLSPYLPQRALGREGWGEVACRTIERYQVTDCQELGEFPRGSGYAGAVRQAAFQFRVKAPRVNSRLLVGSWVRIRITYSQRGGGGDGGDAD
ncbi:hypothetical protein [uncultured Sphingomonas sp.]|uniref:hypothetical protein n=1 Tax=uncultured Sphingomonas sp. TaxID=158754 RepID=UPI0025D3DEEE|nr:hypothetical protein [uncultured Sphingomonas sp.]